MNRKHASGAWPALRCAALLWMLALALLPCAARGEQALPAPDEVGTLEAPEEQIALGGLDNDAAFDGYVRRLFGMRPSRETRFAALRDLGGTLTGNDRRVYDALKPQIVAVAAGERASTVFAVSAASLGLDGLYYADDLGVDSIMSDGAIAPEAIQAMRQLAKYNTGRIVNTLLRDCPYELYWCDKTSGISSKGFSIKGKWDGIRREYYLYFAGDASFSFSVAEAYRDPSAGEICMVDTSIAQTASHAAQNALGVVNRYHDDGDYDKLRHYKEWICDHVAYNYEAYGGTIAYGNPWQLIWVFDGNLSTNVVCEGYAKAFQYLCDMSLFVDDVECRTATGTMGGGDHMWNIVQMPNGRNYIVDVTNCDDGNVGYPEALFLSGAQTGDVASGYTLALGNGVAYAYDDNTRSLYSEAELTLSALAYQDDDQGIPLDDVNFPDPEFRGFLKRFDADDSDSLDIDERDGVYAIDVADLGISSLAGIRCFHRLGALDCSGNALAELDLSACKALTRLDCSGNALGELDLSACKALTRLDCSGNALGELDLSACKALMRLDCSGNALAELDIAPCAALSALAVHENSDISQSTAEFSDGSGLLRFDTGVRLIRTRAALNRLTLPAGTIEIMEEAFAGTGVEIAVIPPGCARIGCRAFADCPALAEVRMPASVTASAVDGSAFSGSEDAIIVTADPEMQAWAVEHGMLWTLPGTD